MSDTIKSKKRARRDFIKTRKQGNALMVTIPKSFNVGEDDFFDFDEDILKDLVSQGDEGQKLINEFKKMKKNIPAAMDNLQIKGGNGYEFGYTRRLVDLG